MKYSSICYFGTFDPEYERNRVLIAGLRSNGVQVQLCTVKGKGLKVLWRIWRERRKLKGTFDAVFVGYSDTRLPILAAKLMFRCPVVWDAFYSLYDSIVFDRQLVKPRSLKALYYRLIDWTSCILADKILLDTESHISYFVETFGIKKGKFIRAFIGADDQVFYPRQ